MKELNISNSANEHIYERAKLEILRQLLTYKEEGFKMQTEELPDVDGSKIFLIKGFVEKKPLFLPLALYYDLDYDRVFMSSEEGLENYLDIATFKGNVLEKPHTRERRRRC